MIIDVIEWQHFKWVIFLLHVLVIQLDIIIGFILTHHLSVYLHPVRLFLLPLTLLNFFFTFKAWQHWVKHMRPFKELALIIVQQYWIHSWVLLINELNLFLIWFSQWKLIICKVPLSFCWVSFSRLCLHWMKRSSSFCSSWTWKLHWLIKSVCASSHCLIELNGFGESLTWNPYSREKDFLDF